MTYRTTETVYGIFSTSVAGVPTTLGGTPALSVYKNASTTQSTAGVTLTVDFDSITGLNHFAIDLSSDAFYVADADYSVIVTTGTVGGVSVVGRVVGSFSTRVEQADVVEVSGSTVYATSIPTAVEIRQEIDANSSRLFSIVEDTGTTLPAQISALNNLSSAEAQTAAAAALTAYDPPNRTEATSDKAEILTRLGTPADTDIATDISNISGGGSVTVGDITSAALAKFMTVDTGESVAATGSVAKIAQGSAGGAVEVASFTTAALAQFATDDTGEVTAANGSVAKLAQYQQTGSFTLTIGPFLNETTGDPIDGLEVLLTTGAARTSTILANKTTNASGYVTMPGIDKPTSGDYHYYHTSLAGYTSETGSPVGSADVTGEYSWSA